MSVSKKTLALMIFCLPTLNTNMLSAEDLSQATSDPGAAIEVGSYIECTRLPKPVHFGQFDGMAEIVDGLGLTEKSPVTGEVSFVENANTNVACWVVDEIVTDTTSGQEKTFAKVHFAIDDRFKGAPFLEGYACIATGPVYSRGSSMQLLSDFKLTEAADDFCTNTYRKESYSNLDEAAEKLERFVPLREGSQAGTLVINLGF